MLRHLFFARKKSMSRKRKRQIDETFRIAHDELERMVTLDDGSTYTHRCNRDSFEKVAHAIEEAGEAGTTIEKVAEQEDLPISQVAVARAFLLERGLASAERRRVLAADDGLHLAAMVEWYALKDEA